MGRASSIGDSPSAGRGSGSELSLLTPLIRGPFDSGSQPALCSSEALRALGLHFSQDGSVSGCFEIGFARLKTKTKIAKNSAQESESCNAWPKAALFPQVQARERSEAQTHTETAEEAHEIRKHRERSYMNRRALNLRAEERPKAPGSLFAHPPSLPTDSPSAGRGSGSELSSQIPLIRSSFDSGSQPALCSSETLACHDFPSDHTEVAYYY